VSERLKCKGKAVRLQGIVQDFRDVLAKMSRPRGSDHPSMASISSALAQCARASLKTPFRPQTQWICQPCFQQLRAATTGTSANAAKYRRNKDQAVAAKKKKQRNTFIYHNLKDAEQFALCDAMRYVLSLIFHFPYELLFEGQEDPESS
jgi:hypothetical protein